MTNEDVVKGKIKQVEGKAQNVVGVVADNPETEAKGKLKQAEGAIQEGFGKVKEAVKNAVDNTK